MKRFLFVVFGLSVFGVAFAAGENVPTSKSYVDSKMSEKQDTIPANDGATQVLTNTGTAGNYGTKDIYDATGEYSPQAQNLVDAATMNAGVQNAINSEFQCIEYDESGECLLFDVFGTTAKSASKNLFNLNNAKVIYKNSSNITITKNTNGYTLETSSSDGYRFANIAFADINDYLGKKLRISVKFTCIHGARPAYHIIYMSDDGTAQSGLAEHTLTVPEEPPAGITKLGIRLYANANGAGTNPSCTYYDIMVEEGSVATEYEPYKNLYIPAGEH